MSPRPDKYLDTDDDMQDHHSSLLLQDLGDNRSYVDVEQPPKFKNSHTEKAPEGRWVIPESVWDHEKRSTEEIAEDIESEDHDFRPTLNFLYTSYQNFDISCHDTQQQGIFK